MTARLLDGRSQAAGIRDDLKQRVQTLIDRGEPSPSLRIVLVGTDESNRLYASRLQKGGVNLCMKVVIDEYDQDLTPSALAGVIESLNQDASIDGIVVPMPLPTHLPPAIVWSGLDPQKDVDGVTIANAGSLYLGRRVHVPSTASAIMEILNHNNVEIRGRNAVVVGRSAVVGKPVAIMLLSEDATVTICHSRTTDLAAHTQEADILVVAAGNPELVRGSMIKPGAVVIDAGINPVPGGIVGDVTFEEAVTVAGAVTPVPGGVGPLTNALLLRSVMENAESRGAELQTGSVRTQ